MSMPLDLLETMQRCVGSGGNRNREREGGDREGEGEGWRGGMRKRVREVQGKWREGGARGGGEGGVVCEGWEREGEGNVTTTPWARTCPISSVKYNHCCYTSIHYNSPPTDTDSLRSLFSMGIDFVHPDPCRSKFKPSPLIETGAWLRIDL